MGRKRKPKASDDANVPGDATLDASEDVPPVNMTSGPYLDEAPPAPGAGSWIVLCIHKTRLGDSHRVLSQDWKPLPYDTAGARDPLHSAMRFETQDDANTFINGELSTYGDTRPLCFYNGLRNGL
jgi:hypothetical protein